MTGARRAVTLGGPVRPVSAAGRVRDPVQTVEPHVEPAGGAPQRGPGAVSLVAVVLLVLAASVLAIQSRLGVVIAVGLAIVAASLVFTLRRGFAFVELDSEDAANKAIAELNDTVVDGRAIKVAEAHPRRERTSGGFGRQY